MCCTTQVCHSSGTGGHSSSLQGSATNGRISLNRYFWRSCDRPAGGKHLGKACCSHLLRCGLQTAEHGQSADACSRLLLLTPSRHHVAPQVLAHRANIHASRHELNMRQCLVPDGAERRQGYRLLTLLVAAVAEVCMHGLVRL